MGALYKNVCYPSSSDVRKEFCSAYGSTQIQGGTLYSSECAVAVTGDDLELMTVCKRVDGGSCAYVAVPYPEAIDCDFSGGVSLGMDWMYVAMSLVVTVWGLRKLIKLFDTNTTET